jgi:hypothetical protein
LIVYQRYFFVVVHETKKYFPTACERHYEVDCLD